MYLIHLTLTPETLFLSATHKKTVLFPPHYKTLWGSLNSCDILPALCSLRHGTGTNQDKLFPLCPSSQSHSPRLSSPSNALVLSAPPPTTFFEEQRPPNHVSTQHHLFSVGYLMPRKWWHSVLMYDSLPLPSTTGVLYTYCHLFSS